MCVVNLPKVVFLERVDERLFKKKSMFIGHCVLLCFQVGTLEVCGSGCIFLVELDVNGQSLAWTFSTDSVKVQVLKK